MAKLPFSWNRHVPKSIRSMQRHRIDRRVITMATVGLAGLLDPSMLHAADISWTNLSGGSFNATGNWNTGAVPGINDRAVFNISGLGYLVRMPAAGVTNSQLLIGNDILTFRDGPSTYTLTNPTDSIVIGDSAGQNGKLTVGSAELIHAQELVIGNLTGSNGSLSLLGDTSLGDSSLTVDGTMFVGRGGNGTFLLGGRDHLVVQDMSIGAQAGSTGTVLLGTGSLSSATFNGNLYIGGSSIGAGGAGSIFFQNQAIVGVLGTTVIYAGGNTSFSGSSTVTFNNLKIDGASKSISPSLITGDITVTNGGSLLATYGTSNLPNNLTISGGSFVTNNVLKSFENGAVIGAPGSTSDSNFVGSANGGSFGGAVYIGGNASNAGGSATFGGNITADSVHVWQSGTLTAFHINVQHDLINDGHIDAVRFTLVDPPQTVGGNFTQSDDGSLHLLISVLSGLYTNDRIDVTGAAALDGDLNMVLVHDPNMPLTDQSFTILTAAGGVTGVFDNAVGTILISGEPFNVIYNPNSVVLTHVPEPAGVFGCCLSFLSISCRRRRRNNAGNQS